LGSFDVLRILKAWKFCLQRCCCEFWGQAWATTI
jgi:hypothetical protein